MRDSINSPAFLLNYLHILDIVEGRLVFQLFSKMSYSLSTGDMRSLAYCQSHAPTLPLKILILIKLWMKGGAPMISWLNQEQWLNS